MAKKSIFSSKRNKEIEITEDDYQTKKGSLFGKALFSKPRTSQAEDFDIEDGEEASVSEGKPAKSFLSLGRKQDTAKKSAASVRHNPPYTMFGKPIKGSMVSIDFDDEEVRLLIAKTKRSEIEVLQSIKAKLPEGVVLKGDILDPAALADTIRQALDDYGASAQYAMFGLNNTDIIVRPVNVPLAVEEADIEGLISFELQQYLDIDPESYVIEYTPAAAASAGMQEEDSQALLAYAVPRRTIEQHLAVANALKMVPYVFDLRSNSLEKWLEKVEAVNNRAKHLTEQNIGIIHLTKSGTDVFLYSKGQFVTSNHLDRGYGRLLEVMEAPAVLKDLPAIASGEVSSFLVKDALDDWLMDAANHVINTENFYATTTNEMINSFYIFGDEDVCRYLTPILKARLGREAEAISTMDCQDMIWGMQSDFASDFIPATATLLRRAN